MLNRTLIALFAVVSSLAHAQGYFDFTQIPGVSDEPKVQIDLNPAMLGFVQAAASAADPAAAEVLAGIEGVRVLVYDILDDSDEVMEFIDDASGTLERDGWQRAVYIQDDDARVRVYMKFEGTTVAGMTVMVADPGREGDAVFINVAGEIDPTKIGELAASLGVGDVLGGVLGGGGPDFIQETDDPSVEADEDSDE
ncbi:DUF4252 domain-containing protein [Candidatus Rariloculus sp.]|uniref:DUF4252 domain-containing protein n=1 Tax=Candidatus Rariloculus sp. TaxID=3101265 RepID=UPI003D14200C